MAACSIPSSTVRTDTVRPFFLRPRQPSSSTVTFCLPTKRSSTPAPTTTLCFGFESLKETFPVDVSRAEGRPLDVPLVAPFTLSTSRLDAVGNVAIRVELRNGSVGWGEVPILPFVTAEDQPTALAKANEACQLLVRSPVDTLGAVLEETGRVLSGHEFASIRSGIEMALIDAAANSIRIPLWKLFGAKSNSVTTDITIPIVSPKDAAELASNYRKQGFSVLKLKVGKNLTSDIEVLRSIKTVHPDCSFILDANEGYTPMEAIEVLDKLHEMGVIPVLFEQPVQRDDWEGLGHVSCIAKEKYGVSVAADESCRSLQDALKIIHGNLAHVINIKLAKLGVLGALEIIEVVRSSGLTLMIGGMVETRLAMGFAGHLAAGLGCFSFVDLDTPLLLSHDPVLGGYEAFGAVYKLANARGHGGFLHWDSISWVEWCRTSTTNGHFVSYDSNASTVYGLSAFGLLLFSQLVITVATKCLCCGKGLAGSKRHVSCAIVSFVFSWLIFLGAEICLLFGSAKNAYHTKYVGYYAKRDLLSCAALRKGVFTVAAALIIVSYVMSLFLYWSHSRADTGGWKKHMDEGGVGMTGFKNRDDDVSHSKA